MKTKKNVKALGAKFYHGKHFATDLPDGALYSNPVLGNPRAQSRSAVVEAHFDQIEQLYVDLIEQSEVVVGAVAWLTNARILEALRKPRRVAIVVQ